MKSIREYVNMLNEAQLNELADAPYTFTKISGSYDIRYKFNTGDVEYIVKFMYNSVDEKEHADYKLTFIAFQSPSAKMKDDVTDAGYGITGTGNAFKVFATLQSILMAFLKEYEPASIYFSSLEVSRTKLYARMMKTIAPHLPDYKVHNLSNDKIGQFSINRQL